MVRDLGSTNGIQINGRAGKCRPITAGDELSIAHFRYRVDEGPDSRPDPFPPRPKIGDLLSQNSRFRFISRN